MSIIIRQNGDATRLDNVTAIETHGKWLRIRSSNEFIDVRFFEGDEISIVRW